MATKATTSTENRCDAEHFLLSTIPNIRHMGVRLCSHDAHRLTLRMDLAPNLNDKDCAFGGSLASLLTFSGWGLVAMHLRQRCMSHEVYIQDSTIEYLVPIYEEIRCSATLAGDNKWARFHSALSKYGRGRICVTSTIHLGKGQLAAIMRGRYVAKKRVVETASMPAPNLSEGTSQNPLVASPRLVNCGRRQ